MKSLRKRRIGNSKRKRNRGAKTLLKNKSQLKLQLRKLSKLLRLLGLRKLFLRRTSLRALRLWTRMRRTVLVWFDVV